MKQEFIEKIEIKKEGNQYFIEKTFVDSVLGNIDTSIEYLDNKSNDNININLDKYYKVSTAMIYITDNFLSYIREKNVKNININHFDNNLLENIEFEFKNSFDIEKKLNIKINSDTVYSLFFKIDKKDFNVSKFFNLLDIKTRKKIIELTVFNEVENTSINIKNTFIEELIPGLRKGIFINIKNLDLSLFNESNIEEIEIGNTYIINSFKENVSIDFLKVRYHYFNSDKKYSLAETFKFKNREIVKNIYISKDTTIKNNELNIENIYDTCEIVNTKEKIINLKNIKTVSIKESYIDKLVLKNAERLNFAFSMGSLNELILKNVKELLFFRICYSKIKNLNFNIVGGDLNNIKFVLDDNNNIANFLDFLYLILNKINRKTKLFIENEIMEKDKYNYYIIEHLIKILNKNQNMIDINDFAKSIKQLYLNNNKNIVLLDIPEFLNNDKEIKYLKEKTVYKINKI